MWPADLGTAGIRFTQSTAAAAIVLAATTVLEHAAEVQGRIEEEGGQLLLAEEGGQLGVTGQARAIDAIQLVISTVAANRRCSL